jgi:hypothetical protein
MSSRATSSQFWLLTTFLHAKEEFLLDQRDRGRPRILGTGENTAQIDTNEILFLPNEEVSPQATALAIGRTGQESHKFIDGDNSSIFQE